MIGRQVSNYLLESKVGEGRTGAVYRAQHGSMDRPVSIKVLNPAWSANPRVREWLFRECRVLDQIRHPHIAQIHDVYTESEQVYIIQEWLPGKSLDVVLENGRLDVDEVVGLGEALLSALCAVHAQDIIHLNIKPSNIMMTPAGVRLMGFGIARSAFEARMLAPGRLPGAAPYTAPELWQGQLSHTASDIYSLGVILYTSLVGASPFSEGLSLSEYASAHLHRDIPDVTELCPAAPDWLADVIEKMTRRRLSARMREIPNLVNIFRANRTRKTASPLRRSPASRAAGMGEQRKSPPEPLRPVLIEKISAGTPKPPVVQTSSTASHSPGGVPVQPVAPSRSSALPPAEDLPLVVDNRPPPEEKTLSMWWVILPMFGVVSMALGALWVYQSRTSEVPAPDVLYWLMIANPESGDVVVSCVSGPAGDPSMVEILSSEESPVAIYGLPAHCEGRGPSGDLVMEWRSDWAPTVGNAWTVSVGEFGEEIGPEDVLAQPEPEREILPEPEPAPVPVAPAPRPRRPSPPPAPVVVEANLHIDIGTEKRRLRKDVVVYVDGEDKGEPPLTVSVTTGEHTIRWVQRRYDITCTVEVTEAGRSAVLDVDNERCP